MTLYILYRIGVFLALALPLKFSYFMADLIGGAYCRLSAKDREAVTANLKVVLGGTVDDKELQKTARGVFKNFAKYLVDFFRFARIDKAYIDRRIKLEGLERIDAALRRGKGAIMLSAHIGNWELGAAALSLSGYPINAVVLTHQNKMINDFFTRQRLKGKMRPIEIGATLKACYRALKGNGLLALLGDRDFTKNGLHVDFFGKTALIPKGPAVFAYREGAAILPTFMVREPDDTFRLFIDEPLYADPQQDEESAVTGLAKRYLISIESCVRKYPSQWYVFRDLWEQNGARSLRPDTII
jgi:KDO2-lipid IV(A) lauroyltransferase